MLACERSEESVRSVSQESLGRSESVWTYPSGAAKAVYILLEALDAFVEVVVIVRADVDENAAAEDLA